MTQVTYKVVAVNGLRIAYREAGDPRRPTILLLHGFPSASHMFRDLIPVLAPGYHIVAPDLPGFGASDMPSPEAFAYTFENLAEVMVGFVQTLQIKRFSLYLFDYGAPVGLRLAMAMPQRVEAIISQSGNAYEAGLGAGWDSMRTYWSSPTEEYRNSLRAALTPAATEYQYTQGVPAGVTVSPDGMALDIHYLARPGAHEPQLHLFTDYGSNIALYPAFQALLREQQYPVLAVWGEHDPYFLPAGASAFAHDVPNACVRFYDTGHFALETHAAEIGSEMLWFLDAFLSPRPER